MLKGGVLKPVHEATPWINSFVLVEEGQAWKFEIENLLGPHQSKQNDSEGTIPLQNTRRYSSFACRCLYYVCV